MLSLATMGINMMEELEPVCCHWKFLSVKLVIFFTFWQQLLLALLRDRGALDSLAEKNAMENTLICVEMLVMSCAHLRVWPPSDSEIVLAHIAHRQGASCTIPRSSPPTPPMVGALNFADVLRQMRSVSR